jgi:hypothetical protein
LKKPLQPRVLLQVLKDTLVTAFGLASKASDLFESPKTSEKRELVNLNTSKDWLLIIDKFRTFEQEIRDNLALASSYHN